MRPELVGKTTTAVPLSTATRLDTRTDRIFANEAAVASCHTLHFSKWVELEEAMLAPSVAQQGPEARTTTSSPPRPGNLGQNSEKKKKDFKTRFSALTAIALCSWPA